MAEAKVYFVLKSHNKLQLMLIKTQNILVKTAFGQKHGKTWHFGKIMAFDENHGFRDFRVHDFLLSLFIH